MLRKLALLFIVVAGGVTAFFVFHHPPMRLMPPPLLYQTDGQRIFDASPALEVDSRIDLFYVTNRLPVGTQGSRIYTVAPDRRLHFGTATLRIGEDDTPIEQILEWSKRADTGDRPFIRLERMQEAATLPQGAEPDADTLAWFESVDAALAASRNRDVLVYVHGANTTVERAAGQAAQLKHFAGRDSVVVLYVWPTAENFLRYSRDIENAFGASPHLAEFLELLAAHTNARNIDVFTYSAGATIGSDGLARLATDAPQAAERLGEIYHAAPDADFRGFVDDLQRYSGYAERVTTAVNLGDSALRLAGAVNRASRAGRPDLAELSPAATEWLLAAAAEDDGVDILQVHPENMPDLAATSHTFWYDDPWVSNDLLLALLFNLGTAERGLEPGTGTSGTGYWTFPTDYPERIAALGRRLAAAARMQATP
ncbi:MAG TPA: alpha/beta hydrolase [Amaricoccus sp.]|uniref:alpha/beta hydrolase n=1 Tax=Amaricoccus sp. TaxID=1872485 RepID=UPI002CFAA262|nr:alpha/beta hydrolase [Amaricoccus sp.]HMQ94832.1 alpha/beta hydrolase [Amaricoccus sp.]HMR54457.1 alpha/beta hydrolase [Amaricoccus sp.]HMR61454.1 alpha/beta hydrolase [Amaricoccus sp.]HMU01493.1 alpha/beta hydrolase [Amaricoccus sp.]